MRSSFCRVVTAAAVLALSASFSYAATATITSISSNWINPTYTGSNITTSGPMSEEDGSSSLSWGVPAFSSTAPQSGYEFMPAETPIFDAPSPFDLGVFTHNNFPIRNDTLSTVDLSIEIIGNIDGVEFNLNPVFSFKHLETVNDQATCPAGGVPPCPDLVTITNFVDLEEVVNVNGVDFTLVVDGFRSGDQLVDEFLTLEGQANSAVLAARFTQSEVPPPPPMTPVPLPASALLLLGSLGLIAASRRRRP